MTKNYVFFKNLLSYSIRQRSEDVDISITGKNSFIIIYKSVPKLGIMYEPELDHVSIKGAINGAIVTKADILCFVNYYMSISPNINIHNCEKYFNFLIKCKLI